MESGILPRPRRLLINAVEREMRSIASGTKNWLYCGSDLGGRAAAVHVSLITWCHGNPVNPFVPVGDIVTRCRCHAARASRAPAGPLQANLSAVAQSLPRAPLPDPRRPRVPADAYGNPG